MKIKELFENTAHQKYYHGSYIKLEIGTVLKGRNEKYERDWNNTDFYNILEFYRPKDKISHKQAVFMVHDEDDIDLAGGATDWIFVLQPLGTVSKHAMNWASEISALISDGYEFDSAEVYNAALNYWNGTPHTNESVWEYLTKEARIIDVYEY